MFAGKVLAIGNDGYDRQEEVQAKKHENMKSKNFKLKFRTVREYSSSCFGPIPATTTTRAAPNGDKSSIMMLYF